MPPLQLRPVDGDHVRPVAEYASDEKESGISCSCHMGFQVKYLFPFPLPSFTLSIFSITMALPLFLVSRIHSTDGIKRCDEDWSTIEEVIVSCFPRFFHMTQKDTTASNSAENSMVI